MLDEQLRDELAAWADSARHLTVPGIETIEHRVRRSRTVVARRWLAAAAAAAVIVIALVGLPSPGHTVARHHRHRPPPVAVGRGWRQAGPLPPAGAGPGAAPYFVTIEFQQSPAVAAVVVARTGQLTGTVRGPGLPASGGTIVPGFTGVDAAGDDRTFVLSAPGQSASVTMFYELRLSPAGRPLPLIPLSAPAGADPDVFALSPDGRQLALSLARDTRVEVLSLATGRSRVWYSQRAGRVYALAWAGEHRLVVGWADQARRPSVAAAQSGLWILSTAGPGSGLLSSRPIVPAHATPIGLSLPSDPVASADGSVLFATVEQTDQIVPTAWVQEYATRTGNLLHRIPSGAGESGHGSWCGALWTDPSGRQATFVCGMWGAGYAEGTFTGGRLSRWNLHVPVYTESIVRPAFIAW